MRELQICPCGKLWGLNGPQRSTVGFTSALSFFGTSFGQINLHSGRGGELDAFRLSKKRPALCGRNPSFRTLCRAESRRSDEPVLSEDQNAAERGKLSLGVASNLQNGGLVPQQESGAKRDGVDSAAEGVKWRLYAEEKDPRKWEFVPLGGRKPGKKSTARKEMQENGTGNNISARPRDKAANADQGGAKVLSGTQAGASGRDTSVEPAGESEFESEGHIGALENREEKEGRNEEDPMALPEAKSEEAVRIRRKKGDLEATEETEDLSDKASRKAAEDAKQEAARRSLETILAGLERNAPRSRPLGGASARGTTQQPTALAGNLGGDPSVSTKAKWEESRVDVSLMGRGPSLPGGAVNSLPADPIEFARELAELDGFPVGTSGSRRFLRQKAHSLSSQKVLRTVEFLRGVSSSHGRKFRKFQQEALLAGGAAAVSSEAGRVKPWLGDKELAELLTPLVGKLNTVELNKVLKGLGEQGNWKMAVGVLKWMEAQPQAQPDEYSYSTVRVFGATTIASCHSMSPFVGFAC